MGLEPTNLLTASQALYQLSYAPGQPATLPAGLRGIAVRQPPVRGGTHRLLDPARGGIQALGRRRVPRPRGADP